MVNIDEIINHINENDKIVVKVEFLDNQRSSGSKDLEWYVDINSEESLSIDAIINWSFVYHSPDWEEGPQELEDLEIDIEDMDVIIDTEILNDQLLNESLSEEEQSKITDALIGKIIFEE